MVRAYHRMLPALRAEDALALAPVLSVGTGAATPASRRELIRDWERAAGVTRARGPRPMLASVGIGVRLVTKTTGCADVCTPENPRGE